MAVYVARHCNACKGIQVIPEDERLQQTTICKECGASDWEQRKEVRGVTHGAYDRNWSSRNGGKGHYVSALETKMDGSRSDHAHVQSVAEMKRKCAERGLFVTRDGF